MKVFWSLSIITVNYFPNNFLRSNSISTSNLRAYTFRNLDIEKFYSPASSSSILVKVSKLLSWLSSWNSVCVVFHSLVVGSFRTNVSVGKSWFQPHPSSFSLTHLSFSTPLVSKSTSLTIWSQPFQSIHF